MIIEHPESGNWQRQVDELTEKKCKLKVKIDMKFKDALMPF